MGQTDSVRADNLRSKSPNWSINMLNRRVVIYVPSKIGNVIHADKQKEWKRACMLRFAELFGGATAQVAEGAYKADDGSLIVEDVVLVFAMTDRDSEVRHHAAVLALAQEMATDMRQECVSVEIDGGMIFKEAA